MAKRYVKRGIDEASEIVRLFVDHYRSGRIALTKDIAGTTFDRAQIGQPTGPKPRHGTSDHQEVKENKPHMTLQGGHSHNALDTR